MAHPTTFVDTKKDIEIPKIEIVFQDPFHLKNLYKAIFWWLSDNGYLNIGTAGGNDGVEEGDLEVFYSEIVRPGATEYEFWWRTEKPVDNPYFRYQIWVDYLGLGIRDTEVVKDEKRYKMQIGEITIRMRGWVITEAHERKKNTLDKDLPQKPQWKNNPILKYFYKWFNEKWYVVKKEEHEDQLTEEMYRLQQHIKNYLELKQYEPTEDFFFETKGYE